MQELIRSINNVLEFLEGMNEDEYVRAAKIHAVRLKTALGDVSKAEMQGETSAPSRGEDIQGEVEDNKGLEL